MIPMAQTRSTKRIFSYDEAITTFPFVRDLTAAAVRNAERLVQIQMRDIGAEIAGLRQPDQRVQISTVRVDLPAGGMNDCADLDD